MESLKRKRGRPPRADRSGYEDTRQRLIREGLAVLTERGYSYSGLDGILRRAQVPKGSFYYYFSNKEDFGRELIQAYGRYFEAKLEGYLDAGDRPPLARLEAFIEDAKAGMRRFEFRRGCLIGNLGQEMAALPESFRALLQQVFRDWEARTARCLAEAQASGEMAAGLDPEAMARLFWIGWEGAVLRAKLDQSTEPLDAFARDFLLRLRPQSLA